MFLIIIIINEYLYMAQIHNIVIVLSASHIHAQKNPTNTMLIKITHTFSVTIMLIPILIQTY